MPLRIAFDLDGVLADMESELARQAEMLFGESMTHRRPQSETEEAAAAEADAPPEASADAAPDSAPPMVGLNLTGRQQRRLWRHIASIENFWERLEEVEAGAIQQLAALAVARRWEVIFLTRRPETAGATAQAQTQRWLASKGFALPSVFVVQRSRGRIAEALALDVVIDDRPENCLDVVVDSKARAILLWRAVDARPPAAAQRLNIGVVKSVAECLDILVQIDSPARDRPGVMSRVLRLLGLKEPAST